MVGFSSHRAIRAIVVAFMFVAPAFAQSLNPRTPAAAAHAVSEVSSVAFETLPYEQLRGLQVLRIESVELAAGQVATLVLDRFEVSSGQSRIVLGTAAGDVDLPRPQVVMFSGQVADDADSLAFLSVAPTFTYGFVRSGGRTFIISSGPAAEQLPTRLFDAAALPADWLDARAVRCAAEEIDQPQTLTQDEPPPVVDRGAAPCRIVDFAIDSDNEFTNVLFGGDTELAAAYAATLTGAASAIYTRDLNARLRLVYLRLWSTEPDPWDQTSTGDQLGQYRDHWTANMRHVYRHLGHFLSGRGLGGGVAWLNAVCNQDIGFGLSANLGGSFPYPLDTHNNGNWDIVVFTHEIGHNFGSPHTHSTSPPIDGCGNGDCSQAQQGTIMSYCHQCSGGIGNIDLRFHERNINENMLPHLASTCSTSAAPFDGSALNFDGVSNHAVVPGFGAIAPTNEVTVEFWQYADARVAQSSFGMNPDTLTNRFQAHVPYSDGRIYWDFGNINSNGRQTFNPGTITGQWNHWAFVSSQALNQMRIYRNGVLISSRNNRSSFTQSAADLRLGSLGTGAFLNGRMDEFRMWNVARTSQQIADNYAGSLTGSEPGLLLYYRFEEGGGDTLHDLGAAGGANDATISGASWVALDDCVEDIGACCVFDGGCVQVTAADCEYFGGRFGGGGSDCGSCVAVGACCLPLEAGLCSLMWQDECEAQGGVFRDAGTGCTDVAPLNGSALFVNGLASYVDFGSSSAFNFSESFSVEAWVRPWVLSGTHRVVARGQPGTSGWAFGMRGSKLRFTTLGREDFETAGDYVQAGRWTHIAVVFDADFDAHFYVNGQWVETIAGTMPPASSALSLVVGRNSTGTPDAYWGTVDELRIWNTALSPQLIADRFGVEISGATPGLAGYWRFDDGAGLLVNDQTSANRDGTLVGPAVWEPTTRCGGDCPGDVDGNGSVNLTDLSRLLAHFGTPAGASRPDGDLDGDEDVDLTDLSMVLANFGGGC